MTTVRKHAGDAQANLLSEKMVPSRWLPWLLCRFFLALAGFLILLILACPFLDDGNEIPSGGHRLLAIFARDLAVRRTVDRSRLWAVQTPQAFRREALERALAVEPEILAQATDDAWLVERAGGRVVIVESGPRNFKVTTQHDLQLAGFLLKEE